MGRHRLSPKWRRLGVFQLFQIFSTLSTFPMFYLLSQVCRKLVSLTAAVGGWRHRLSPKWRRLRVKVAHLSPPSLLIGEINTKTSFLVGNFKNNLFGYILGLV